MTERRVLENEESRWRGKHGSDSEMREGERRALFVVFDACELLDLAGPVQALSEAALFGARYEINYVGPSERAVTTQGLELGAVEPLPVVQSEDWVFVPGFPISEDPPEAVVSWLADAAATGASIHSICTGAFALGAAGLLDHRQCTTHWRRTPELQAAFPSARVKDDRLWVEDPPIVTSAGIAAGIDMTLWLLEKDAGREVASAVAREMVVYLRRSRSARQQSIYFDYQDHMSAGVHRVQEYLIENPGCNDSLADLGRVALMSARHLSRSFRRATGSTVGEFRTQLRLEHARNLLVSTRRSIESIAVECGLSGGRQLHRLWVRWFGCSPGRYRELEREDSTTESR